VAPPARQRPDGVKLLLDEHYSPAIAECFPALKPTSLSCHRT
jgi:hypothetical protein